MTRAPDGSAGDADYGRIGGRYTSYRQPEPHIQRAIMAALGNASHILNVGAGAGSYEPVDRRVTAVEPSAAMRRQRPRHLAKAVDAVVEHLPFPNGSFDAALASFTIHQWRDLERGLSEMRRVTRGPIVILSCDPDRVPDFWLADYAPEMVSIEARRYPSRDRIAAVLGSKTQSIDVPIPLLCRDGFHEAYYGRPEMLLDEGARLSNSAWSFVSTGSAATSVEALQSDLENGAWDRKHGFLRSQAFYDGSLRLFVSKD